MLVLMCHAGVDATGVTDSQNTGQNCDDLDGTYQYRLANLEFFEYES